MLTNKTIVSVDQLGRHLILPSHPTKIICAVPSISELLFDLELNNELVGITKFCVKPITLLQTKTRIGGTKNLNFSKIDVINPDLIIANKEENNQEQIEKLSNKYPVWISDVNNLESALEMIFELGRITDRLERAENICSKIKLEFQKLKNLVTEKEIKKISAAYIIWQNPLIMAGSDTFIHNLMMHCGLENCITQNRYPTLTLNDLTGLTIDNILLSSEPFPFQIKHIPKFQSIFPNSKILLVDGEMFSWYGSRLIKAPGYFISLLEQFI